MIRPILASHPKPTLNVISISKLAQDPCLREKFSARFEGKCNKRLLLFNTRTEMFQKSRNPVSLSPFLSLPHIHAPSPYSATLWQWAWKWRPVFRGMAIALTGAFTRLLPKSARTRSPDPLTRVVPGSAGEADGLLAGASLPAGLVPWRGVTHQLLARQKVTSDCACVVNNTSGSEAREGDGRHRQGLLGWGWHWRRAAVLDPDPRLTFSRAGCISTRPSAEPAQSRCP